MHTSLAEVLKARSASPLFLPGTGRWQPRQRLTEGVLDLAPRFRRALSTMLCMVPRPRAGEELK
jgi:hypothetical protein